MSVYNNTRWRNTSKKYRKRNPLCEVWLHFGFHVKADVTDHLIRHEIGGAFWLDVNYMAMSHFWHNRKRYLEMNGLDLDNEEVKGGLIPTDREQIFRIFAKRWSKEIDEKGWY